MEAPLQRLGIALTRLPWGGPRVAAVVAGSIMVAELAQSYLSAHFGWAMGGLAAGLVLFTVSPLQRAAEGRTSHRRPGTLAPSARSALYEEQARLAWRDGTLTARERVCLDHLRERLGLRVEEANQIEAAVLRARAERPGRLN